MKIHNKVFGVYGSDVAAEQIASSKYVTAVTPEGLAQACMKDIDLQFHEKLNNGKIMVAAQNFGCNSSREWAPRALKFSGVELVIADSFARIFFRNAINIGFPIIECQDICQFCEEGDELDVDLSTGVIKNLTRKTEKKGTVLPDFLLDIMTAGGLLGKLKAEMKDEENRAADAGEPEGRSE